MSPFACSMVTLAALLAAADAKITKMPLSVGGRCAWFKIDITSRNFGGFIKELKSEFTTDGDGQLHNIADRCASELGAAISSQTVRVCNEYYDPNALVWNPPNVMALGDEQLSPVFAACDPHLEASHECGPLSFHITQACSFPWVWQRS